MYDGVLCCALSLYFSLSNTIHTDDKCFFARVIDGYVSRICDLLCVCFNHRITKQGFEFTVVPSLHPLHTISRGKEIKYGGEVLPARKPHSLHRTCPTCVQMILLTSSHSSVSLCTAVIFALFNLYEKPSLNRHCARHTSLPCTPKPHGLSTSNPPTPIHVIIIRLL